MRRITCARVPSWDGLNCALSHRAITILLLKTVGRHLFLCFIFHLLSSFINHLTPNIMPPQKPDYPHDEQYWLRGGDLYILVSELTILVDGCS